MNWLVYKGDAKNHTNVPLGETVSSILYSKLNPRDTEVESNDTAAKILKKRSTRSLNCSAPNGKASRTTLGTYRSEMGS